MATIQRGLAYLPRYLGDFGSVLIGPKRSIAQRHANAEGAFRGALMFLSCSVVVMVLLWSFLAGAGKPFGLRLAGVALGLLIEVSMFAAVLWVAWAAVGARSTVRSFFVTYAYFSGVVFVIPPLCEAVADGIVRVFEPEMHEAISAVVALPHEEGVKAFEELGFLDGPATVVAFLLQLCGFVGAVIWALIGWGAFRQLHGVGKWRSLGALATAGSLVCVIVAVTVPLPPFPAL